MDNSLPLNDEIDRRIRDRFHKHGDVLNSHVLQINNINKSVNDIKNSVIQIEKNADNLHTKVILVENNQYHSDKAVNKLTDTVEAGFKSVVSELGKVQINASIYRNEMGIAKKILGTVIVIFLTAMVTNYFKKL